MEAARSINAAMDWLTTSRVETIEMDDTLIKSKIAWKFATLRQALTYRLVDLGVATIGEWSAGNLLASLILARFFIETAALIHSVTVRLKKALDARDLDKLDGLAMKELFGARLKEWIAEGTPRATNVLDAIDDMSETIDFMREFYERLSETAHPNATGVGQFYATTDKVNIVVSYSRTKRSPGEIYGSLIVALGCAEWSVNRFREYDQMIILVAELHAEHDAAAG